MKEKTISNSNPSSVKALGIRFGISFIFLAAIVGANHYLAEERIKVRESMSDITDQIARQRMLAQRIALLSKAMVTNEFKAGRKTFRAQLLDLTDQMEKAHDDLVRGSMSKKLPSSILARIKAIYTDEPHQLHQNTQDFLSSVRNFANLPDEKTNATNPHFLYVWSLAQSTQLVEAQDKVVQIHQSETEQVIQRNIILRKIQLVFFLSVLVFMALFVFLPMARRVKKEIENIAQANLQLDQQARELSHSNQKLQDKESSLVSIMGDLAAQKKQLQQEIQERVKAQNKQAELLEKLEQANRDLNDFAHVVSHDLKAPLRGIGSMVDWLAQDYADKFDEDGRRDIGLMKERIKRMHNMIGGLLELAKVGRSKEGKVDINVKELVDEVIDLLAPPKEIQINVNPHLPVIRFEKARLQQVFQNLLSNALKYMNKPDRIIHIGYQQQPDEHLFTIQDNGPGIEKKFHDKIFGIFETLKPRDSYESTGIGLSLVKKIIENEGGKIWIESELGQGTTFFFSLPTGVSLQQKGNQTDTNTKPFENAA